MIASGRVRAVAGVIGAGLLTAILACGDDETRAPRPVDAGADDPAANGGSNWQPPSVDYPDAKSDREFALSETGLYRDLEAKQLAPDLIDYEPAYVLWSDGAEKRRWLRLPPGTEIDSSEMDHWVFPVGATLFKEFVRAGKRLETRLIARLGPEPDDYFMGAFVWNDDESDAFFARGGEVDVRETEHDVPEVKRCFTCHNGERGRVLGYSAIQQPSAAARLSDRPAEPYLVPGDELSRQALGYLHANCGNCHNPNGTSRTDTNLSLRLSVVERAVEDTAIYQSTVATPLDRWRHDDYDLRIEPGDPEQSAVLARMKSRTKDDAMPPFASDVVDRSGVELVERWIESLQR